MPCNAMKIQTFFVVILAVLIVFPSFVRAQINDSAFSVTGFPLPRFVSLASDKVYLRIGPGTKYPVLWEYQRKGLPVEIVMEFDVWRKIKDHEGTQGWVHKSLLSGKRTAISAHDDLIEIKRKPESKSRLMAYAEPKSVLSLEECMPQWCRIEAQGYSGFVERKYLWGIYENETID